MSAAPNSDPLSQLRDIHLPDAVPWWPPAPGWWVVAVLVITVIGYGIYRLYHWRKHNLYRKQALAELDASYSAIGSNPQQFSQQVLALLRRTARTAYPLRKLAAAPTAKLLEEISNSAIETGFDRELRQQLTELPYQHKPEYPANFSDAIYRAARLWIKNHRRSLPC